MFGMWQHDGEDSLQRFRGHRNYATVKGVNFFGPNSEFVISGSDCGNIFIWESDTSNIVNMFHGDEGGVVNVLEPHPHDPILATAGLDHNIKIWTPTFNEPVPFDEISANVAKTAKKNAELRSSSIEEEGLFAAPSITWMLLRALGRRRRRDRGGNNDSDSTDSSDDSSLDNLDENDSDDDEAGEIRRRYQCAQS